MNKIKELNKKLNRRWQQLPGFIHFVILFISIAGLDRYWSAKAFMGFFVYWALICTVLMLMPENVFSSAEQASKPKENDKETQKKLLFLRFPNS